MRQGKLCQEQLTMAMAITKEAVQTFVRRQIASGNWQAVQEVLNGKTVSATGAFLVKELRDKVVGKLIKRLALRPFIALGLAVILIPLIIAKVSGEIVSMVKNCGETKQD